MIFALRRGSSEAQGLCGFWGLRPEPNSSIFCKELIMTWETPTALDFRFGMEITMYIANR